jgi:nucleotide-binding universal stress UspA family protein
MPIKQIVLHQGRDARSHVRLELAAAIAAQHDSYIFGIFSKSSAIDQMKMKWIMSGEAVEKLQMSLQETSDRAKEVFEKHLSEKGLSGEWHTVDGGSAEAVTSAARLGDLTIIGQSDPDEEQFDGNLPDQVVLSAGSPILIVPYAGTFSTVGKRVMIAWDGGREAARAVREALPLIQKADKVVVYSIASADNGSWPDTNVGSFLARHDVQAELNLSTVGTEFDAVDPSLQTVGGGFDFQESGAWTHTRHFALAEINTGDALLSAITDNSIDLLVMGAYGHMRLQEVIFGGVTRQILKSMTVPVLMSN